MEQGGSEDEEHIGWERVWHDLGEKELIDCRDHHLRMGLQGNVLWHGPNARIQPSWGPLIRLLLSFKNPHKTPETNDILDYQKTQWGSVNGETVLAEIAGIRSKNVGQSNVRRKTFICERIRTFQTRLQEYSPDFVVFYGNTKVGRVPVYQLIIEKDFSDFPNWKISTKGGEKPFASFTWLNSILVVQVFHPTYHGASRKDRWIELGLKMRKMIDNKKNSHQSCDHIP